MTRLLERRSAAATFAVPALLALLTLLGLMAGLAGEGRLSLLAWIGVGMPAAVALAGLWSGRASAAPSLPGREREGVRRQATSSTCGRYAP